MAVAELGRQVEAGQHIVVRRAIGNPADERIAVGLQCAGRLIGVHKLHPDIAAQRDAGHGRFDVELGVGERNLFLDRVVAAPVSLPVFLGQVELTVQGAQHVVVEDARDTAIAERCRVVEKRRVDRRAVVVLVGVLRGAVAVQPGEVDIGLLGLGAIRIVQAEIHAAENPPHRVAHLQAQGVDPVDLAVELLATVVAVVVRIGEDHGSGVAQVDGRPEIRITKAGRRVESDAGEGATGQAAEQVSIVQLHRGAGGRQIRHGRPVAEVELVVPAYRIQLVVFLGVFVLQDRRDAVHRARGDDGQRLTGRGRHTVVGNIVVGAARPLRAVGEFLLVEGGVVQVELGVVVIVGRPFEYGHQAVALLILRLRAQLHAFLRNHIVGHARRVRSAPILGVVDARRAVVGAPPPGLVLLLLDRLIDLCNADGEAQRVVEELIDVREARTVPVVSRAGTRVEVAVTVVLAAQIEHEGALGQIQRIDGVQIHRAGQTLANQAGVRCLVHRRAIDQLGRVLIVFDATVLADGRLLPPIERGACKVRRKTADRDGAGLTVNPLRRQTRQSRQAVGNADIRQLADVLRRDGFDNVVGVLLHLQRALNAAADAGHHDGTEFGHGRLGLLAGRLGCLHLVSGRYLLGGRGFGLSLVRRLLCRSHLGRHDEEQCGGACGDQGAQAL